MATYTIQEGQTIFDVALQLYGDVSQVYTIIKANPTQLESILTRNLSGKVITYELQDNDIANYFRTNAIIIATEYPRFNTLSAYSSAFSSSYPVPSTT